MQTGTTPESYYISAIFMWISLIDGRKIRLNFNLLHGTESSYWLFMYIEVVAPDLISEYQTNGIDVSYTAADKLLIWSLATFEGVGFSVWEVFAMNYVF